MEEKKIKVLICNNLPAPYTVEVFNLLAKECDLTVVFYQKTSSDRSPSWFGNYPINFKVIYLDETKQCNSPFSLMKYVLSKEYDVCIMYGYSIPIESVAILALRTLNKKFIISLDGAFLHKENFLKRLIKKVIISSGTKYLSSGHMCDEYLLHYGVPKEKIYKYHFSSIHEHDILKENVTIEERNLLRKKLNLNYKRIVIGVGSFFRDKGFDVLINAFYGFQEDTALVLVGGKPTEEYKSIIKKNNLKNVIFIDHVGKNALREYYKASDIFVLPTRHDVWGLVINEALSCGLPSISTNMCVAAQELIVNGFNGYVVPVDDINGLHDKIKILLDSNLESMHENARRSIADYTLENMSDEYYDCIQKFYQMNRK